MIDPKAEIEKAARLDTREEVAPDCFSYRGLPDDGELQPLVRDIVDEWKREDHPWQTTHPEWGRFTIVSDEFPNPPYPHGLYFEGWSKAPHEYDPPRKEAKFNYPLTAQKPKAPLEQKRG